jgi:alpha-tubulin suppressor-like RCC1 family protein
MAYALRADGSVQGWGNPFLGNGSTGMTLMPAPVASIAGARAVSVGVATTFEEHACALLPDKTVSCWGGGAVLQLGYSAPDACRLSTNVFKCSKTATVVPSVASVRQVSAGSFTTCVVHTNDDLECWGDNNEGALGDGTTGGNPRGPNGMAILSGVAEVAVGDGSACARMNDGTVRCWGDNRYGQLGVMPSDGACGTTCLGTPTAIAGLTGVAQIAMAGSLACARMNDGTVRCWGDSLYGQAGPPNVTLAGGNPSVVPPAQVMGVTGAVSITVSGSTAFAILADGSMLGWGDNSTGLLGDGTTMGTRGPVAPHF